MDSEYSICKSCDYLEYQDFDTDNGASQNGPQWVPICTKKKKSVTVRRSEINVEFDLIKKCNEYKESESSRDDRIEKKGW